MGNITVRSTRPRILVRRVGVEPTLCCHCFMGTRSASAVGLSPHIGWDNWTRTSECQSQSLMPYRLAISHHIGSTGRVRTDTGFLPADFKSAAFATFRHGAI